MTPQWKKRLTRIGALVATGAFVVPVAAYVVGRYAVGPYEGDGGLVGFLGTIYVSAWRGEWSALTLIGSPILIALIWRLGWWFYRRPPATTPEGQA